MTPVGHLAGGYLLHAALPRRERAPSRCGPFSPGLVALGLASVAPDLDFLLLPFAWFNQFHRTATHSLLFVFLVTLLLAWWLPWLRLLLGGLLHLIIDTLVDSNPTNGVGVAWLWPWSATTYNFGITLAVVPTSSWNDPGWSQLLPTLLNAAALELPLLALALLVFWRTRLR